VIDGSSTTAMWSAVVGFGLYHGINPGMGWPLAVSAALMQKRSGAMRNALLALAAGHLLAMAVVLLPFSLVASLAQWDKQIRFGAGLVVICMGIYLLINRRHPRWLARVKPTRLALWSFLAAMAHGAGLMLVPIFGAINMASNHVGHSVLVAAMVVLAHTLAMAVSCAVVSIGVYRWLGLKFLSRSWFNLDIVWALSLVLVGGIGVYGASQ